jgi:hypothetical protein
MGYDKDVRSGAKELARILGSLDQSGQVIAALAALVQGKATGHLAVTDGKGNLQTLPLPGLENEGKECSLRRRGQLEALRRGIRFDDDGGLWIERCPFSEIFVEHDPFNEHPPFLEGPLAPSAGDDGFIDLTPWNEKPPWVELCPFEEIFAERAFREADPGGTLAGDGFIDLTPWNEKPPFVEGPWNEEPPWVELDQDHRGLTKSWRWKALAKEPLAVGDTEAAESLLARCSIVETFERIKNKLEKQ